MSGPVEAVAMAGDSTKSVPWKFHFQSRFSLVEGRPLAVWATSVGYAWGPFEREVTLGYQWLGARGTRQLAAIEKSAVRRTGADSYYRTSAGFVSLGYWHIVHNTKRWKFGFPLELSVGRAEAQRHSLNDIPLSATELRATIAPLQAGGYGEWKATRWVGVGLQIGYRQNLARFEPVDYLNGPYGRLRVLIYTDTYRDWYRFLFKQQPLPSPFFFKTPPQQ